MEHLLEGRAFQLWDYKVSHGFLVVRSPADVTFESSVDLVFSGVQYISSPRHLGEIVIKKASEVEVRVVGEILNKPILPDRIWVLKGSSRSLIVAASMLIREHRGAIFDSALPIP